MAVARHLGLFEAVIASDRMSNQKGGFKRTAIREVVGMGVFDYMGDGMTDLPIFQAARVALSASVEAPAEACTDLLLGRQS